MWLKNFGYEDDIDKYVEEMVLNNNIDCLPDEVREKFEIHSLLLTLDKDGKECQKNGKKPVLFFGFDLITSYQRAKACVDYLLDENENNGNTWLTGLSILKQDVENNELQWNIRM